ncbi:MAG TPA: acetoacetate decarboxylase family protein [Aeromicrobium sp.]|nr:acetoacetate decarboxylase family protein [Aeromicrobium sp.]
MDSGRPELAGLAGIPETALPDALVETLPPNEAGAPWDCTCTGLIWLGRGGAHATRALPPALRTHRARATVGGFVRYADTPVGPYDEVFGLIASNSGLRSWGNVAFMAVDSRASLVGGRTNWAMPKVLSTFGGEPAAGSTMTGRAADGVEWSVSATPRALGPAVRVRSRSETRQQFSDGRIGTSRLRFEGRVRPAFVQVEVRSAGPLASWLRPGRHLGAIVESATFTLGEPRFTDS